MMLTLQAYTNTLQWAVNVGANLNLTLNLFKSITTFYLRVYDVILAEQRFLWVTIDKII
jgi:hypothetical protein